MIFIYFIVVIYKALCMLYRFGRRPTFIFSVVLNLLSKVAQVWSPSATVYIICRMLVAFGNVGRYTVVYVLGKFYTYLIIKFQLTAHTPLRSHQDPFFKGVQSRDLKLIWQCHLL